MTEINGSTVITMTMKQLICGGAVTVVAVFASFWAIQTFTVGRMGADISDIRAALTDTQARNADTQKSATTADGELRRELSDLTAQLKITNAGLESLTKSVAGLDESMKSANARQENFERWVVARLGQDGTIPTSTPLKWREVEGDIVKVLTSEGEPLSEWYSAIKR